MRDTSPCCSLLSPASAWAALQEQSGVPRGTLGHPPGEGEPGRAEGSPQNSPAAVWGCPMHHPESFLQESRRSRAEATPPGFCPIPPGASSVSKCQPGSAFTPSTCPSCSAWHCFPALKGAGTSQNSWGNQAAGGLETLLGEVSRSWLGVPSHSEVGRLERGSTSPVRIPKAAQPLSSPGAGHGPGRAAMLRSRPRLGRAFLNSRQEQFNGFPKCFPISPSWVKALTGISPSLGPAVPKSRGWGCGLLSFSFSSWGKLHLLTQNQHRDWGGDTQP